MATRALPWLLLPLLLGGCEAADAYHRPGTWRPEAANERNLRAMLVRPEELVRGTGEAGAQGATAAQAIERLRADRVKPLPDTGLARLVVVANGGGSGN
ncbi:hypothetical protein [Paracraurococcus ruber]|nr:hypothetical protein [Paracraurococcus ruber]TDG30503.1 hypothetical protein E2C05_14340 [Paracraurococcus ruber]